MFLPAPTPYPGDFDGDLNVDFADFFHLCRCFLACPSSDANYDARMDMSGDGIINFFDFLIFARIFWYNIFINYNSLNRCYAVLRRCSQLEF